MTPRRGVGRSLRTKSRPLAKYHRRFRYAVGRESGTAIPSPFVVPRETPIDHAGVAFRRCSQPAPRQALSESHAPLHAPRVASAMRSRCARKREGAVQRRSCEWAVPGSNRGPLACKANAPSCHWSSDVAIVRQGSDRTPRELPLVAVRAEVDRTPNCTPRLAASERHRSHRRQTCEIWARTTSVIPTNPTTGRCEQRLVA